MNTSVNNNNIESKNGVNNSRKQIKVGDKVRHNLTGDRVATVTGIRRVQGYKWEGEITVYRLDFGESVKGPFGTEMNGGEFLREAFTPCTA